LEFQVKRGGRPFQMQPELVRVGEDRVIGSALWVGARGRRQERHHVLTIRDGKIIDMQGCRTRLEAERFATGR
jgi:hypothetical protein